MAKLLKISEAASLAMHAMVLMASNIFKRRSVGEMAKELKVSEAHLSKVLQRLGRVGLVRSIRGPRGGFTLGKDPRRITLLEVYEAIDGPLGLTGCLFGTPVCSGDSCILGECLIKVYEDVRRYLHRTKLSSLGTVYGKG